MSADLLTSQETRWLLIFDNVCDDALIRASWPTRINGQGDIIITAQDQDTGRGLVLEGDRIQVRSFVEDEGVPFLLEQCGIRGPSEIEKNMAPAIELCASLGGLPFAIVQVAAFVRNSTGEQTSKISQEF